MKNIKLIIAALASFAALSCEKESLPQSTPESNLVPLVLTTGDDTKTSLQTDGSIHWSAGDQISVIDNGVAHIGETNIHSFSISNIRGSKATFSGNVRRSTSQICAVYPAGLVVSGDIGGTFGTGSNRDITVRIPSEQSSKEGTFNDNLNISVAKTSVSLSADNTLPSDLSVTFKNACALLSFTMPSTLPGTITSVTIASSVAIAGNMNIDYSGDTPRVESLSNPVKRITMVGDFVAGKTYWFVLAPVTLNGISIIVHDSEDNIYVKSRSGEIKLNQGTYRSLGTLNFDKMRPITVSSEHTYGESNGESKKLTGTKLNMSLPEDLTAVSLSVKNSDGNEVRKIDDLSRYSNGVIINTKTKDTDWPYLPKGDYTVSGSYTSSAGGVIEIFDYPFKVSETPSARTVTQFEPYTSYTNRSNSLDGSTIYIKFKVNVSDEILTNSAYTSLFKFKLNGSATSAVSLGSGVLESTLANQAWKAHTITSVTCSFDDSQVNDYNPNSTVHVTGIPYTLSPSKEDSGWTKSGTVKWNQTIVEANLSNPNVETAVKLGDANSGSSSISRTFPLPASTNVTISAKCTAIATAYREKVGTTWLGTSKYEYWYYENIGSVCVGDKVIASANTKQQTNVTAYVNPLEVQFKADKYEASLDGETSIVCSNSHDANSCYTGIYSLEVKYKE